MSQGRQVTEDKPVDRNRPHGARRAENPTEDYDLWPDRDQPTSRRTAGDHRTLPDHPLGEFLCVALPKAELVCREPRLVIIDLAGVVCTKPDPVLERPSLFGRLLRVVSGTPGGCRVNVRGTADALGLVGVRSRSLGKDSAVRPRAQGPDAIAEVPPHVRQELVPPISASHLGGEYGTHRRWFGTVRQNAMRPSLTDSGPVPSASPREISMLCIFGALRAPRRRRPRCRTSSTARPA